jgi:hypothetical protein
MKLAVIFHGLSSGLNDKKEEVLCIRSIDSIKNSLVDRDVDYFFHTWGSRNDNLVQQLRPKSWIIEDPIETRYQGSKVHSTISRFTSLQKSLSIFNDYRSRHGVNYHGALIVRFDLLVYGKIVPEVIRDDTIALPFWGNYRASHSEYLDYYLIIGKNHFEKFDNIVLFVNDYIDKNYNNSSSLPFSNHIIIRKLIETFGGSVEFSGREYKDFCLDKHFKGFSNKKGEVRLFLSKQFFLYILSLLRLEYPFKRIYGKLLEYANFNRF